MMQRCPAKLDFEVGRRWDRLRQIGTHSCRFHVMNGAPAIWEYRVEVSLLPVVLAQPTICAAPSQRSSWCCKESSEEILAAAWTWKTAKPRGREEIDSPKHKSGRHKRRISVRKKIS